MNIVYIIIIIVGLCFLGFELYQMFGKKGGHKPGQ